MSTVITYYFQSEESELKPGDGLDYLCNLNYPVVAFVSDKVIGNLRPRKNLVVVPINEQWLVTHIRTTTASSQILLNNGKIDFIRLAIEYGLVGTPNILWCDWNYFEDKESQRFPKAPLVLPANYAEFYSTVNPYSGISAISTIAFSIPAKIFPEYYKAYLDLFLRMGAKDINPGDIIEILCRDKPSIVRKKDYEYVGSELLCWSGGRSSLPA